MKWLLALIPGVALAGPVEDHEKARAEAEDFVAKVYHAPDTHEFCMQHPLGMFPVQWRGMEILIDCSVRNRWVALQARR